jgi:hypothetical protein
MPQDATAPALSPPPTTRPAQVLCLSPPGGGLLLSHKARAQASVAGEAGDMARLYHARIAKLQQELAELEADVQNERQK